MAEELIVRFVVKDDKAVKDALKEQKGASDELVAAIKAASMSINGSMVLPLKDAWQLLKASGGDTKKFEQAMRQAGVPIRDAKLMAQELNKWMDQSRRAVLGIGVAGRQTHGILAMLPKALRDGAFAAEAMHRVLDKGREKLQEIAKIAKIKGFEEATQDAEELDKQLNKLRAKLNLIDDEKGFAGARETIQSVALQAGVPQKVAIEAVLAAQEKKSMGREVLADNGAILRQLFKSGTGDFLENEEMASAVESQITTMKDLGLMSADDIRAMQGITRAGEEKGSLSAKNIQTKGGGVIAQLMGLQGTTGLNAYRKGQALLQTMADDPKLRGDIDLSVNRAENMLSKLADDKTRERFRATYGFDPMLIDKKTGSATLRPMEEIATGIRRAETEGKLSLKSANDSIAKAKSRGKKVGRIQLYEVFRDAQAREGMMSVIRNPERLTELENVDPEMGNSFLDRGYSFRMATHEGVGKARQARAEVFSYQNFLKQKYALEATSEMMSEAQNHAPGAAGIVDTTAQLGSRLWGDKGTALIQAGGLSALGIYANWKRGKTQDISSYTENRRDQERQEEKMDKALADLLSKQKEQERHLAVTLNVNFQNGQQATVTAEAKTGKEAARGGKRVPTKAGQH